jgi:HSP20 family protein
MPRRDTEEWFWQVGSELHRITEEMSPVRPRIAVGRAWEPRIDLIEESGRFLLKADIAGVSGEDIQLLYLPERNSIVLKGTRDEEDYSDSGRTGIHQLEIFYGEFQREVRLPDVAIDPTQIRAQYRNGFLLVTVPKAERMSLARVVTVENV